MGCRVFLHALSVRSLVACAFWGICHSLGAHTTHSQRAPLPDFNYQFQSGIAIGLTARSPSSPPYLLLLFFLEAFITAIGDLYLAVSEFPDRIGYTLLSVFWVIIPFLLVYLLGTLPLQPALPAVNVARVGEVRNPV
jgi:hypothetical protein